MRTAFYRVFACLLASVLLCSQLTVGSFAAAPPDRIAAGQAAAEELYGLGLIQGSGKLPDGSPDFALDRVPHPRGSSGRAGAFPGRGE